MIQTLSEHDLHQLTLASFRDCAPLFHALGDANRQDIIMMLAETDSLNVGQISAKMTLSRPAVSHHLKVLLQAGLVAQTRVSRENFYSLSVNDMLRRLRRLVEVGEVSCSTPAA